MSIKPCTQTKCCFLGTDQCPVCSECGAKSNLVEDDLCVNCHCCLKDENFIRKGVPDSCSECEELEVERCQIGRN